MSRVAYLKSTFMEPVRSPCGGGAPPPPNPGPPRYPLSTDASSSMTSSSPGRVETDPERLISSTGVNTNVSSGLTARNHHGWDATSQNRNDSDEDDDNKPAAIHRDNAVEARILKEIEQLSDIERQKIIQDVHGEIPNNSTTAMGRDEEVHSLSFDASEQHFKKLRKQPGNADILSFSSSRYAKDSSLRRQMLTAECSDASGAANRLLGHLRLLHDILGPDVHRPVTLADFSEQERHLQRKGTMQLFKFRDKYGRRVVGCFETGADLNSISQVRKNLAFYQPWTNSC
jgi:hypothetical protein